jgi:hypothetical protein
MSESGPEQLRQSPVAKIHRMNSNVQNMHLRHELPLPTDGQEARKMSLQPRMKENDLEDDRIRTRCSLDSHGFHGVRERSAQSRSIPLSGAPK